MPEKKRPDPLTFQPSFVIIDRRTTKKTYLYGKGIKNKNVII